ncbi:Hsp20/alpha crystallin family protein [Natrarchaeobius halalkaliphilus]|uniref:Hsp20/alpha crystallin family protein n=1 Tax=Natrarchaeobius halalkaliphilus TaxID=1679091 RepID=A0A3N6LPV6_9EURY|nr:Hsp20/alpha crystallin family protein [Natrarchaeobius halalkaliphilus]RQG88944.1 Hsp20/alpha crystallin family protein [Natrarchaeobius halalkaliphilus]
MNLNDLRTSVAETLYRQVGRTNGRIQTHRHLPVDVLEDESSYLVVFDAPGTEPDDVQVRYVDGTIRVRFDRFREFREGFDMRFPGRGMTLEGEVDLPADAIVDPDTGMATLSESGTVRIEIPKDSADSSDEGGTATDDLESDASDDDVVPDPAEPGELAVED